MTVWPLVAGPIGAGLRLNSYIEISGIIKDRGSRGESRGIKGYLAKDTSSIPRISATQTKVSRRSATSFETFSGNLPPNYDQ